MYRSLHKSVFFTVGVVRFVALVEDFVEYSGELEEDLVCIAISVNLQMLKNT